MGIDVVMRHVPGGWEWWRLHISVSLLRGSFESGTGWSYAGCIHRWARRIGPLNVALLRLIGDHDNPYREGRRPGLWAALTRSTGAWR